MDCFKNLSGIFLKSVILLFVFVLYFCNENFTVPEDNSGALAKKVSKTYIDSNGGGLTLEGTKANLMVPPGSIIEPTEVTIQEGDALTDVDNSLFQIGSVIKLGPEGTNFDPDNSAILTIPYDSAKLTQKGFSPNNVRIFYFDENIKSYVDLGGVVNTSQNTVSTKVHHFSTYVAMAFDLLVREDQKAPVIGYPAYYPNKLVNIPFDIRIKIHDYNNAIGLDTQNAMANVECYWAVTPFDAALVPANTALSGSILHMERYRNENDTYHFMMPANTITSTKDTLKINIIARDNTGFISTLTYPLIQGSFRVIQSIAKVDPDTLNITGGYKREMKCNINAQYDKLVSGIWTTVSEVLNINPTCWKVEVPELGTFNGNWFTAGMAGDGKIIPDFGSLLTIPSDVSTNYCSLHVNAGQIKSIHIIGENGQILNDSSVIGICRPTPYIFDAIGYDEFGNKIVIYPYWSVSANLGKIETLGSHAGSLDTNNAVIGDTGNVCISLGGMYTCVNVSVCNGAEVSLCTDTGIQAYPAITYDGNSNFGITWGGNNSNLTPACLVHLFTSIKQYPNKANILLSMTTTNNVEHSDVYFNTINHQGLSGNRIKIWEDAYISNEVTTGTTETDIISHSQSKVAFGSSKFALIATEYHSKTVCDGYTNTYARDSKLLFTTISNNVADSTTILKSTSSNSNIVDITGVLAMKYDGEAFGILASNATQIDATNYEHHIFFTRVKEDHTVLLPPVNIVTITYNNVTLPYFDLAYNKNTNEYGVIWLPSYYLQLLLSGQTSPTPPTDTNIKYMRINKTGQVLAGPVNITSFANTTTSPVSGNIVWNGSYWGVSWWTYDNSIDSYKVYFTSIDTNDQVKNAIIIAESGTDVMYDALMDWGTPFFGISYISGSSLKFATVNGSTLQVNDKGITGTMGISTLTLNSQIGLGITLGRNNCGHAISTGGTSFGIVWSKNISLGNYDIYFKQMCP